jgi:transcriptional regulator with XRE-family HTH domain
MLTQAVAVYFRELREGRGYTQESLATAVDVSKRTVERLERSEGDISVEPFERIITVLGASPEEVNYLATNPSGRHMLNGGRDTSGQSAPESLWIGARAGVAAPIAAAARVDAVTHAPSKRDP